MSNNQTIELREAENAKAAIIKALEILGEHYGAVQILASHETVNSETVLSSWGYGNFFARKGMAQDFLDTSSAKDFAWQLKHLDEDDE